MQFFANSNYLQCGLPINSNFFFLFFFTIHWTLLDKSTPILCPNCISHVQASHLLNQPFVLDPFSLYLVSLSLSSYLARDGGRPLPVLPYPSKRDCLQSRDPLGRGWKNVSIGPPGPTLCLLKMVATPELIYFLLKMIMTNEKQALHCPHGNLATWASKHCEVRM